MVMSGWSANLALEPCCRAGEESFDDARSDQLEQFPLGLCQPSQAPLCVRDLGCTDLVGVLAEGGHNVILAHRGLTSRIDLP
jgi:hypothetical protein